jgi:hypothetical protein
LTICLLFVKKITASREGLVPRQPAKPGKVVLLTQMRPLATNRSCSSRDHVTNGRAYANSYKARYLHFGQWPWNSTSRLLLFYCRYVSYARSSTGQANHRTLTMLRDVLTMTHAHELSIRPRSPILSSEPLVDRALPYVARVDCIHELVVKRRVERFMATSHYFPTKEELRQFQAAKMLNSFNVEVTAKLEGNQTWFVFEEPVVGDLSWTIMYLHNLTQHVVRGLFLRYSDAAPGSKGREAFHLVELGSIQPNEPRVIGVDLFVPPAMFFEGRVPLWSIDIVDAF